MVRLKLDQDSLGLSSLMERITGARVKDCFQDEETIYFVVSPGEMGKAIGKGGSNIRRVQQEFHKKIKVVEFNADPVVFIQHFIYPLSVEEISVEDNFFVIKDTSKKTKSLLIGRDSRNLKQLNRAVQRFFNKEVKVV